MKILYLISSINSKSNGLGGHYHSLLQTVLQVSKTNECYIVNIGTIPAKTLQDFGGNIKFVSFKYFNPISVYLQLHSFVISNSIEVIHSFDRVSFFWGRVLGYRFELGSVLTQCGGPNRGYMPFCRNTIFFSLENLEFYQTKFQKKSPKFQLIPNRITKFESDDVRIMEIKRKFLKDFIDHKILLRICRIGSFYKNSTRAFIKLIDDLNLHSIPVIGIIIGTIENENEFLDLTEFAKSHKFGSNIIFLTEDEYSRNAKSIINIADVVFGTGRSLMEAASMEKPLLFPHFDGNLVLLSPSNFMIAFYFNFSQRVRIPDFDFNLNFSLIKSVLIDPNIYKEYALFSKSVFSRYFDSNKIGEINSKLYLNASLNRESFDFFDLVKNFLLLLKVYISR